MLTIYIKTLTSGGMSKLCIIFCKASLNEETWIHSKKFLRFNLLKKKIQVNYNMICKETRSNENNKILIMFDVFKFLWNVCSPEESIDRSYVSSLVSVQCSLWQLSLLVLYIWGSLLQGEVSNRPSYTFKNNIKLVFINSQLQQALIFIWRIIANKLILS